MPRVWLWLRRVRLATDANRATAADARGGRGAITAIPDVEEELAETAGALDPESEDPALVMTVAVAVHLAFRRSELGLEREDLLRQAARAQFEGDPPEHVGRWLAEQGVEV
jgi:hypothetical protein